MMGVKLSNNSYGARGREFEVLKQAIQRASDQGMLMIAAAGNYNSSNDYDQPTYPASYKIDLMISVAASTETGNLANFSSYGEKSVHLVAPGTNIYTTNLTSSYGSVDGTSFSAPFVTAAAALIWSQNPSLTAADVRNILFFSARGQKHFRSKVSRGLLDLDRALRVGDRLLRERRSEQVAPSSLVEPAYPIEESYWTVEYEPSEYIEIVEPG